MATQRGPTGPNLPMIKRLFAHSGNRCAFPRCSELLVDGSVAVGQICHIRAARPGGSRYDPQQTAEERHGYDNLILLCAKHHAIIDRDEEAYTAEHVVKMKVEHERLATRVEDEFAERAAQLLLALSVISVNQSGGISAQNINVGTINIHPPSASTISSANDLYRHRLVIDTANIIPVRIVLHGAKQYGNIGMLVYNIKIVNLMEKSVTIDKVLLSYDLDGRHFGVDSHVLLTGIVYSPNDRGNTEAIIVRHLHSNIVIMGWKNLRVQLGENRLLPTGAVLAGSAGFILDFKNVNYLAKLTNLAITVIDYSGNETRKEIPLNKAWIEQAKIQFVENRTFVIDKAGKITYSG